GLENRLILATIYALTFIVTPVYLLGQTIPLVSNYFSKQKLAKITGKILFFSTLGSFMGATFSTLVLMAHIGVHYTATLNFIILAVLIILLSRRKLDERPIIAIALAAAAIYLNSGAMMKNMNIVANNQYNTIVVTEKKTKDDTQRFLILNNNSSSMYSEKGRNHPYIEFIEKTAIDPLIAAQEPKDILIIGAGAFTLGFRDNLNRYDYVDIDKDLKHISETYVLKEKLLDNKTFHPIPARAFLAGTDKKYDLIILDAYLGDLTLPEHLITAEFFEAVKAHLNNGGAVMANFIVSPNFNNRYSRTIDNTFRFVFKNISRHAMESQYAIWNTDENALHNVVYIYKDQNDADIDTLYTDNKNRVFYDKPKQHGSVLKRPNAQENTLHSHE
ncbi:MAG: fused MFS/spermidine synthase, partial [Bdellovibrionales bacterium]